MLGLPSGQVRLDMELTRFLALLTIFPTAEYIPIMCQFKWETFSRTILAHLKVVDEKNTQYNETAHDILVSEDDFYYTGIRDIDANSYQQITRGKICRRAHN